MPSFVSEDFEASSVAVAQAVRSQKHHSTVLTIPSRRGSMASTAAPAAASQSVFSFEEQPLPTLPTPADNAANANNAVNSNSNHNVAFERKEIGSGVRVGSSNGTPSMASSEATAVPYPPGEQNSRSRPSTQYYDDNLAYKDHPSSARERVTRDAPVIAELRTNVIVRILKRRSINFPVHLRTPDAACMPRLGDPFVSDIVD
ncbi:MAG: hypothetical protein INR71_13420 [Terriglobus roseus]|nr:hypothetical protein [Terriglobus roseus]